jgi:hypothetical protein
MCRNIRRLYNFEPAATEEEIRAAALQFIRKISGFAAPSAANREAFNRAVNEVTQVSSTMLKSLVTQVPPRSREMEGVKVDSGSAIPRP